MAHHRRRFRLTPPMPDDPSPDDPGWPPAGLRLCEFAALDDPGALGFVLTTGETSFRGFVVRKGPVVTGYVDRCPHVGAPLALTPNAYLTRDGDHIICSTHGALFRPEDGRCLAGPCVGRTLKSWRVTLEGGWVRTA